MKRHPGAGLVLASLAAMLSGCGVSGLNFVQDTRVQIVSPDHRSQVSLPVTIEWQVSDFTVTGPSPTRSQEEGYFAVIVDRTPQPPGEPLEWYARDDESCVAAPSCPDEEWFARRGIYPTTETAFTIEALPARAASARRELHAVTVVLLDGHGRRIGESAFTVEFELEGRP